MTDEQRLEETKKLDANNDEVEAHRRRIADEETDTNKSDDDDNDNDVEAHRRR